MDKEWPTPVILGFPKYVQHILVDLFVNSTNWVTSSKWVTSELIGIHGLWIPIYFLCHICFFCTTLYFFVPSAGHYAISIVLGVTYLCFFTKRKVVVYFS